MLPLGRNRSWGFQAKGKQYPKDMALAALVRIVTPGYLGAMAMHLVEGRDFNWQDTDGREAAVIVNQAAARRFWPGEDPVRRRALVNGDTQEKGGRRVKAVRPEDPRLADDRTERHRADL